MTIKNNGVKMGWKLKKGSWANKEKECKDGKVLRFWRLFTNYSFFRV